MATKMGRAGSVPSWRASSSTLNVRSRLGGANVAGSGTANGLFVRDNVSSADNDVRRVVMGIIIIVTIITLIHDVHHRLLCHGVARAAGSMSQGESGKSMFSSSENFSP